MILERFSKVSKLFVRYKQMWPRLLKSILYLFKITTLSSNGVK